MSQGKTRQVGPENVCEVGHFVKAQGFVAILLITTSLLMYKD